MGYNIRTTCINPYIIDTGMFKGARAGILAFMLPILKPEWVANRIVAAVRQNEEVVFLPWSLNLLMPIKYLLPIDIIDKLNWLLGTSNSMDHLETREEQNLKKQQK